ncbi:tetratricopeptide repeat protein [Frateuria aurantia]
MKRSILYRLLTAALVCSSVATIPGMALAKQTDDAKPQPLYPNATRKEPKSDLTSQKDSKNLNDGLNAANEGDSAKATPLLQGILSDSKSKYAKALAQQGLANLDYKAGDLKGGISLLKESLDSDALPNEAYFQLEYELAQFYIADHQDQLGIDTVEKWRAEGKRETADSYALEGQAYYNLQKYPDAITAIKKAQSMTTTPNASWNSVLMASYNETGQSAQAGALAQQQLDAHPDDPQALQNAIAVYANAHQYPQAIDVLEKARAAGHLTDEKNYVMLAKLYLISGQESQDSKPYAVKSLAVLKDGEAKGIISDNAANNILTGDAAFLADDNATALSFYEKAAPQATTGEADIKAAQVLLVQEKFAAAKKYTQDGIAKGYSHTGNAYVMLAQAERGLKNSAGAIAAMKKAAQYPETADKANAWLKKQGAH